jgi:hypothetical protein
MFSFDESFSNMIVAIAVVEKLAIVSAWKIAESFIVGRRLG